MKNQFKQKDEKHDDFWPLVEVKDGYGRLDPIVAKITICDMIYDLAMHHKDRLVREIKRSCKALGYTYPDKEIEASVPYLVEYVRQIDIQDEPFGFAHGKIKLSRIRYIKEDLKRGRVLIDRSWDDEDFPKEEDEWR